MTGIGFKASSYELYTRQYEQELAADVSTVNNTEAECGAAQTDGVRLSAKQQSGQEKAVSLSSYLKRATRISQQVKKDAGKKDEAKESSCPIDQARAGSLVGENVPLNWLVADQMGGHTSTPQREDFVGHPEVSLQDPGALVFDSKPNQVDFSGGTLLSQEWLLTPCA